MCVQKKDESSREYLTRWLATRNACESIDDRTAILAFVGALRAGNLLRYNLTVKHNAGTLTLNEIINDASNGAAAEDDARGVIQAVAVSGSQQKKNNNNNKQKNPPEDNGGNGSDMVAMTFQQRGQGGSRGRGKGTGTSRV